MGKMGEHQYYVYAIAAPDMRLPESVSGFGAPLHLLRHGELGAVVSRIDAAEVNSITSAANAENLVRHETVVEAVHRQSPALPVRFGTVLPDGEAVARALAAHHEALREDLRQIGDKIELGVTVLWRLTAERSSAPSSALHAGGRRSQDEAAAPARPGLEYLRARQSEYRQVESARERAQALARELDTAVHPYVLAGHRSASPSERLALRAVYLLERERAGAVESACAAVRQRHQEVQVLVSGPWPPYSFVTPVAREDIRDPHGRTQPEQTERITRITTEAW